MCIHHVLGLCNNSQNGRCQQIGGHVSKLESTVNYAWELRNKLQSAVDSFVANKPITNAGNVTYCGGGRGGGRGRGSGGVKRE